MIKEVIKLMQASTYINSILIGKRNLDHRGSFHVTCLSSGDCFKFKIAEPMFGKSHHLVRILSFCIPAPILNPLLTISNRVAVGWWLERFMYAWLVKQMLFSHARC